METAAAQEKADAIQERFAEWVWADPDRARQLLAGYNRRFNTLVLRDYTADGQRLSLPGLAATFDPRPHQRTAVARMLAEPAVGLFHQVGAGKTAEMVMGAMELRRLGLATKPGVVVPNHMLEQFSREWLQLYPRARLLAASSADLTGERRRAFVARIATGDWDGVVLTRTAFERIPMSTTAQQAYVQAELDALRTMLTTARGGAGLTVKRLERMVMAGEERLKDRLDGARDEGITFEATGIDYLIVDEAHEYKNLRTVTNIPGAAIDGSKRASDLHLKLSWLRGHHGERVATFATATPIANSVTEAHVMTRFLRPDLLEAAGVAAFDAWAATFGRTVTELEIAPTGGGSYRQSTRFARFTNVPEMLHMWHVFADVKTAADLGLPTPDLAARPSDGHRLAQTVIVAASPELAEVVADLGERAERVRARSIPPEQDNMLKITTDGRLAALDLRLIGRPRPSQQTKLDVVADHVHRIWATHRTERYLDASTGHPSSTPGALQIVFCDLGTPTGADWNAYTELRDLLTDRGLPAEQVRFVHEARTDADKARLFAAARAGHVAVLIGSTQKMGVGTNVQARAVALHHVDCPWRPADLEQRDGRILRQGNQNPQVRIIRYATENSFDVYSWQTVERKARFIGQVMSGRLDVREIEDIGNAALSFAEVKALASGDPLILEKATADAERTRLERLARAHDRAQSALVSLIGRTQSRLAVIQTELPAADTAASRTQDTRGEAFTMTLRADPVHTVRTRTEAAESLRAVIGARHATAGRSRHDQRDIDLGHVADLAGHTVHAAHRPALWDRTDPGQFVFTFGPAVPSTVAVLVPAHTEAITVGLIRRLENTATDQIPARPPGLRREHRERSIELAKARDRVGHPFQHADQLTTARANSARIDAAMATRSEPSPAAATQAPEPPRTDESTTGPDEAVAATLRHQQRRSGSASPFSRNDPAHPRNRDRPSPSPAP